MDGGNSMDNIISHSNGMLLQNHLIGVYNWGKHFISLSPGKLYNNFESDLIKDMLIFHDVGKATSYFQEYILDPGKYCENNILKNHSLLSAVLFIWYRDKLGITNPIDHLLAFMAIICHHSNLTSVQDISLIFVSEKEKEIIRKQWESIDKSKLFEILIKCGLNKTLLTTLISIDSDELCLCSTKFLKTAYRLWRQQYKNIDVQKNRISLENYFKLQLLFSLLLDSDKSQVTIENTVLVNRVTYNLDVKKYMDLNEIGKEKTKLNELRKEAFNEIDNKAKTIDLNKDRLMLLTLPTGMGKTLAVYNFASVLRQRLLKDKGLTYRIIYTLPFMSIIDQNVNIMERVLGPKMNFSSMLLKHHHLQPIEWKYDENYIEKNDNLAQIFFEGWNSEIIVTTFVQLLETLIGWTNKKQRKYNKLNNCIIIMDEIQAVPFKYHQLLRNTIKQYVNYFDSYFIGMTATQPVIFKENEAIPLINHSKYFQQLNRITLHYEADNPVTITEFVNKIKIKKGLRYLFIMNTINSARLLFYELKERYPDLKIGYTSAHVVPAVRLERIKKMKKKEYDIVVSTQLIEAGVDVDFDVVYRDLAPLPSLIQSAGRSNREGNSKGRVIVIQLVSDSGESYCEQVYGKYSKTDLEQTKLLLQKKASYTEPEIYSLCEEYFRNLASGIKSQDDSFAILSGMAKGIFDKCELSDVKAVSEFKLIDDELVKFPIFVELNDEAENLWRQLEETISNSDINKWDKLNKLKEINSKMSSYVVNATKNFLANHNCPIDKYGYYYIQRNLLNSYYNEDTGLGVNDSYFL